MAVGFHGHFLVGAKGQKAAARRISVLQAIALNLVRWLHLGASWMQGEKLGGQL